MPVLRLTARLRDRNGSDSCSSWVAEIERVAVEGVCLERSQVGLARLRARLYHDDEVAAAGDVEPKLIGSNSKAGRLDLRIPSTVALPPKVEPSR